MSAASRAYCQRRIDAIDQELVSRRGPIVETGEVYTVDGQVFPARPQIIQLFGGPRQNVDGLLELRSKWTRLLGQQR